MRRPNGNSEARAAKFQALSKRQRQFSGGQAQGLLLPDRGAPAPPSRVRRRQAAGLPHPKGASCRISATLRSLIAEESMSASISIRGRKARPQARGGVRKESLAKFVYPGSAGMVDPAACVWPPIGGKAPAWLPALPADGTWKAPAGALRQPISPRLSTKDGTAEAIDQTAGHDAEHAAMPVFAAEDQGRLVVDGAFASSRSADGLGLGLLPF